MQIFKAWSKALRVSSFMTRFYVIGAACVLVLAVALLMLSSYLSLSAYSGMNSAEAASAMNTGAALMEEYRAGEIDEKALGEALNPRLNPGGVFLMLLDNNLRVIGYTDSAAPYLAGERITRFLDSMEKSDAPLVSARQSGGMAYLMGAPVRDALGETYGYVLAGKAMASFESAAYAFRMRLIYSALPLTAIFILALLITLRQFSRPAGVLMEAASSLAEGELITVREDLPGEIGDIGRTLNHLSQTLVRAFADLKNETDTLSQVVESLAEGVWALNRKGETLMFNSAAAALLGGDESARAVVLDALRAGAPAQGKIQRGEITLLYVVNPLPTGGGSPRGAVALVRDITEQERLERTRYDYVANISHELRTPLASVRGVAEALRDGLVTQESERARYYTLIVEEIKRLTRLVNDLLELSSLQSNPAAFETEVIHPSDLLMETRDLCARLFSENKIEFALEIPDAPLPDLCANEDRLTQVLTIFLDNARKFTGEGGRVTLSGHTEGDSVRFTVRDTGIGMDEETAKRAFERFQQGGAGRDGRGAGLGLSIAREIVRRLGGEIELKTAPGQGSAFSFALKIREGERS